jgi:hypothetical protein
VSFEIWNIYLSKFVKRYVNRFVGLDDTFSDHFFLGWVQVGTCSGSV